MRMSVIEKEAMLFIEVFGLASLPGMLNSFLVSPSLSTFPNAFFAVSMYIAYRALVNIRKKYLEDTEVSEEKDSDKESNHKELRLKEGHDADVRIKKP